MKSVGWSAVSITMPSTHIDCPTSSRVILRAWRQDDDEVGVIKRVVEVANRLRPIKGVFVGFLVDVGVGVLLGGMGVSVGGIGDDVDVGVGVSARCARLARFFSISGLPGPIKIYQMKANITNPSITPVAILRFSC